MVATAQQTCGQWDFQPCRHTSEVAVLHEFVLRAGGAEAAGTHLLKLTMSPAMRLGSGRGSRVLSSSSLELDTLRLYSERVVSSASPSLSFCTCRAELQAAAHSPGFFDFHGHCLALHGSCVLDQVGAARCEHVCSKGKPACIEKHAWAEGGAKS